ncbi:MAG: rubrerythrin family protein [Dehalococcoidales bacterium]|nr:rubrerythrin family protein [Dehalococcoidales bacterium]
MGNSTDNLQAAFAGESQASRKYLYFAEKADKEGQPQVARLFRAASEAETVHARNHLNAMKGIKSVKDNLNAAVGGEHEEFTEMYPGFIEAAKKEGNAEAERTFVWANAVEKIHHGLYQEALKAVDAGQKIPEAPYYVCPVCGNTVLGQAPDRCPICGAPGSKFKKID